VPLPVVTKLGPYEILAPIALHAKGLSEGDVAKIAGGNAVRVLQKVLKA